MAQKIINKNYVFVGSFFKYRVRVESVCICYLLLIKESKGQLS